MPIGTIPIKAGAFAVFFIEGTAFSLPSAGTCGPEAKPGIADTGWMNFGRIEEFENDAPAIQDEEEVWVPDATTGDYVLSDVLEGGAKLSGKIMLVDYSPLAFQLLWRTQVLGASSTQANPNSGKLPKGWLHIDWVNQQGVNVKSAEIFVRLKLSGASKWSRKLTKPTIEWTLLHSSLQTIGF